MPRETDPFPIFCPTCRDIPGTVGAIQKQTSMLCPKCGNDLTPQLQRAQAEIREADRIAKEDHERLNRGET